MKQYIDQVFIPLTFLHQRYSTLIRFLLKQRQVITCNNLSLNKQVTVKKIHYLYLSRLNRRLKIPRKIFGIVKHFLFSRTLGKWLFFITAKRTGSQISKEGGNHKQLLLGISVITTVNGRLGEFGYVATTSSPTLL